MPAIAAGPVVTMGTMSSNFKPKASMAVMVDTRENRTLPANSVVPAEQEANTVVTVLQKGFLIAERVLRPALVTVAAPK